MKRIIALAGVVAVIVVVFVVIAVANHFRPRHLQDEALAAGVDAPSFQQAIAKQSATPDYFHDMDSGVTLTDDERRGRATWLVWSGGNDRLWDVMTVKAFGVLDFLKTLSSHKGLPANRDNRWSYLGLVNEPCFEKATGPDPARYNLWLDKRVPVSAECPADPYENEQAYPGVKSGARGTTIPAGSFYGYATGVVGLRLFPNPAFNDAAAKAWNADAFYDDPRYYGRKELIRPYRVGMSCAFCHAGPNPINPPQDPEHPKWANLSSNVGAQYMWIDRVFDWKGPGDTKYPGNPKNPGDTANFIFQLFHTWRPGTLDTSLISTDNINNPRTMNAVYLLGPRLFHATRFGQETLAGGGVNNRQFNDFVKEGPLTTFFQAPDTVFTPRVLKDGSDSVGALGALNRVYINIGTDSEEWLTHFNPVIGGTPISPIAIADARENSAYFAATEMQTPNTALFFLKSTGAHHLRDAPGGSHYLAAPAAVLTRGKVVFAQTCARCHSSKMPDAVPALDPHGCAGKDYLNCWNKYWAYTKTADYKAQMTKIVLAPDFLKDNYLSTELRVPVTLLHTNACSPLATNAIGGNIWDNFSSRSYKDLPSVGDIIWYDPYTGKPNVYHMPAGGRGYTRPPSLVSLWSTAPYLLNNSVGVFDQNPSVAARMGSFQTSIEQMLWPAKRQHDSLLGSKVPGTIDRTTVPSFIQLDVGMLPDVLQKYFPGGVKLGPIPAGTPVGLLSNLNLLQDEPDPLKRLAHDGEMLRLLALAPGDLLRLKKNPTDAEAKRVLANLVTPLLNLSKCKDFVANRGHYFGTGFVDPGAPDPVGEPGLSDQDKRALIEFLKTF